MESFQPLDADLNEINNINELSRNHLKVSSAWAKFIAISQIILLGLYSALFLFGMILTIKYLGVEDVLIYAIVIIIFAAGWALAIALYKFSKNVDKAIRTGVSHDYVKSFRHLKVFFIIFGIFSIVIFAFMLYAFFIGLGELQVEMNRY